MDDSKKILEDIFEQVYTEFSEYDDFISKVSKQIENDRKNYQKFARDNRDNVEALYEKMYEINEKPVMYGNDHIALQTKIVTIYDVVKDIIDIPKDVRERINMLPRRKMYFKIDNGEPVEINPQYNENIRKQARSESEPFIKRIIQNTP